MGARVGGELVAAGHEVRWLPAGRSDATAARAGLEGLTASGDPDALVAGADVVLSLLPPQAAVEVATVVAGTGFSGTYVDANPVSPGTSPRCSASSRRPGRPSSTPAWSGRRPATRTARTSIWPANRTGSPRSRPWWPAPGSRQSSSDRGSARPRPPSRPTRCTTRAGWCCQRWRGPWPRPTGSRTCWPPRPTDRVPSCSRDLGELREGLAEVGWRWGPELDELALALEAAGLDPSAVRRTRGRAAPRRRLTGVRPEVWVITCARLDFRGCPAREALRPP